MTSAPSYLVTFTIFCLPSQTSPIRMPAEAFSGIEDELCDSCAEELFKNGGCEIYFEDVTGLKDILYFVSDWCTTNCLSTLHSGCQRYCEEDNNAGCESCCTDLPSAVCYTEECINLYSYCCDVEAGTWTEIFRRLPGALPSANPSYWYPAAVPSSDPSNLDDSKGLSLAPTQSPASLRTVEPTRSSIFLPTSQSTMLPTLRPSTMPTYLAPNFKENTAQGVGDFCIANSDCASMSCIKTIGGVEQEALTDDERCSTDICQCGLASDKLQVEWVLQLCCIGEAHINQTIGPIAESLNITDSAVRIKSYWLISTPTTRRQMSSVFAWDIIYEVSIGGDALALKRELSSETFLDIVGTAVEEDIGFPISKIATLELSFEVVAPTLAPTEFPYNETILLDQDGEAIMSGSDNSIIWAVAGAIGGLVLLIGLAYYISSCPTAEEEVCSLEEAPIKMIEEGEITTGVTVRLGENRFEL